MKKILPVLFILLLFVTGVFAEIPQGAILMWSGAISDIPKGWLLCDGQNGTPDLRGRFVLGAGGGYAVGSKGGEISHRLTVEEIPPHSHTTPVVMKSFSPYGDGRTVDGVYEVEKKWSNGAKSESVGGNQPHNNMPPYYSLCYIMKQ